ncbi:MAG: hypothetical protein IKB94_01585 [Clostridia bacterium]|nr:hypothetical protein [Clostridia bacterium]
MKNKNLVRSLIFSALVIALLLTLCNLFEYNNDHSSQRLQTYKDLKRNSVDAVILGTSGMDRFWIGAKAYEEYGISIYPITTEGMPSWVTVPMLKEAEKRQNLKLVVMDMRSFLGDYPYDSLKFDVQSRRAIDILDLFSMTRLEAIINTHKAIKQAGVEDAPAIDISYFLSFVRYHGMWEEEGFSFDELKNPKSKYMGFYMHKDYTTSPILEYTPTVETEERIPLDPVAQTWLDKFLEYIGKQDYEVMFLQTPSTRTKTEAGRLNTLKDYLETRGYTCMVLDIDESIYDLENDFYNDGHVNYYGAEKFTEMFAEYLTENYDLPDRRGDEDCDDWVGVYDVIKAQIKKFEQAAEK